MVDLNLQNPFTEGSTDRFSRRKRPKLPLLLQCDVDSYLKIQVRPSARLPVDTPGSESRPASTRRSIYLRRRLTPSSQGHRIAYLPPAFGQATQMDDVDNKLFRFCEYLQHTFHAIVPGRLMALALDTDAFCGGRTLLEQSNAFLVDYAPMIGQSSSVKYSILALAASYVLDYRWSDSLQERANSHYSKAVACLEQDMRNPASFAPFQEDSIVAGFVLLLSNDVGIPHGSISRLRHPLAGRHQLMQLSDGELGAAKAEGS